MKELLKAWLLMAAFLPGPAAAAGGPLCPGCNVVLISLDALQGAHVGANGYGRPVTPYFDSLAKKGVLFRQAVSPASWTVPATMSWFTGVRPSGHKVVNKFSVFTGEKKEPANLQRLSPGLPTLTEILKGAGYAAGGFTGDAGVSGVFGFSAGFDVYFDSVPAFSGLPKSVPQALKWLPEVKDRKFFLFLHGYDFHGQYVPAGGFDRRYADPAYAGPYTGAASEQAELREKGLADGFLDLTDADKAFWRAIYDEKIARADAELKFFMEAFARLGVKNRTVFVLAADHGTEFFEHGRVDHGATLYDELVRVPLLILIPGVKPAVVQRQVTTLSLMPTILELVGADPGPEARKRFEAPPLTPLLLGRSGGPYPKDVFLETDYRLYTHKRAVRSEEAGRWKYILTLETGEEELYDLYRDPGEKKNLAMERPAEAARLRKKLSRIYPTEVSGEKKPETGCSPVYPEQCADLPF